MTTKILIADDHQMFREALRRLLESHLPPVQVVAETGDGLAVLPLVRETRPDIICMDIGMPGMNGVEVTRMVMSAFPNTRVIALSAYTDQRYVADMLQAGAMAYISKSEASAELMRAIDAVRNNRRYFGPDMADALAGMIANGNMDRPHRTALGPREVQVMQLIAEGHTSPQIGERLHIAASTVEVHRRNLMRKLDLHNVAELTRYAIQNGYLPN